MSSAFEQEIEISGFIVEEDGRLLTESFSLTINSVQDFLWRNCVSNEAKMVRGVTLRLRKITMNMLRNGVGYKEEIINQ